MEWCVVIVTALIVAGVGVAAGLAAEKIADLEQHLEQAVAGMALAGVPIAILLWIVKVRAPLVREVSRRVFRTEAFSPKT